MFNVSVVLFSDVDASQITRQIANLIERATGQPVRVSLVDNRAKNQEMLAVTKSIQEKLLTQKVSK